MSFNIIQGKQRFLKNEIFYFTLLEVHYIYIYQNQDFYVQTSHIKWNKFTY
jgi:hypothetical protein